MNDKMKGGKEPVARRRKEGKCFLLDESTKEWQATRHTQVWRVQLRAHSYAITGKQAKSEVLTFGHENMIAVRRD